MVVTVSGMSTVADVSYRWFEAPVRQDLEVTQVRLSPVLLGAADHICAAAETPWWCRTLV
jgi:hypothetical protein